MEWIYKNEKRNLDDLNDLIWYMILGTVIGARLGHCLFYNPEYYLANPIEILKVWTGGLASHGAAVGILAAIYLYSKKKKDQGIIPKPRPFCSIYKRESFENIIDLKIFREMFRHL